MEFFLLYILYWLSVSFLIIQIFKLPFNTTVAIEDFGWFRWVTVLFMPLVLSVVVTESLFPIISIMFIPIHFLLIAGHLCIIGGLLAVLFLICLFGLLSKLKILTRPL